jgi:hypothetical protein
MLRSPVIPRLRWCALVVLALGIVVHAVQPWPALAQSAKSSKPRTAAKSARAAKGNKSKPLVTSIDGVFDYSSKNFLIHTDLSADEARDLLERLETMLDLIAKYWGRPSVGVIEMYVVKDLHVWPRGAFPDEGWEYLSVGAGVTLGTTLVSGTTFRSKATVYAVADRGTPQHEAVHAYCIHAFGRSGPIWYSEGMAEMGQYWRADDHSVNAEPYVIEYLRLAEPKGLRRSSMRGNLPATPGRTTPGVGPCAIFWPTTPTMPRGFVRWGRVC